MLGRNLENFQSEIIIVSNRILEIRKSHGGFFFLRTIFVSKRNLENPQQSRWFWGPIIVSNEIFEIRNSPMNFFEFWQKKARRPVLATGGRERMIITIDITRARRGRFQESAFKLSHSFLNEGFAARNPSTADLNCSCRLNTQKRRSLICKCLLVGYCGKT